MKKRSLLPLCFILGASLNMRAEQTVSPKINVRPARTIAYVKPGEKYEGNFLIANKSDKAVTVSIFGEDWTSMASKKREKNVSWLTLSTEKCAIEPLKTARIAYTITIPADAAGEKLAQIYFQPAFSGTQEGMIKIRTGVLVIAIVSGTERLSMGLPSVSLVHNDETHVARVRLENLGNVLFKWSAEVSIKDKKTGKNIGTAYIRGGRSTLPGESLQISGPIKEYAVKNSGNLSAEVTIHYGIEKDNEQEKTFVVPVSE
jgi:hypothetical protein